MKKFLACLLMCVMIAGVLPFTVASAAEDNAAAAGNSFKLSATSNAFPTKTVTYSDVSRLEDENGDVFLTVEYKYCAKDMYLINLQMDELTWDNKVLEFKEAYNLIDSGRRRVFTIFPFAQGNYVINTFGDDNCGRIVGNYSAVQGCAYAYNEGSSPITVIRAVFKLLDKTATETTVNSQISVMSLCDETEQYPYSKYGLIDAAGEGINPACSNLGTFSTEVTEEPADPSQLIGDTNLDGKIDVTDATFVQMAVAKMRTFSAEQRAVADTNADGNIDITDATYIQMYIAKKLTHLG